MKRFEKRFRNRSRIGGRCFRTPKKERARRWSRPVGCFVMSYERRSRAAWEWNATSGGCDEGNSAAFSTTLQSTIVTGAIA